MDSTSIAMLVALIILIAMSAYFSATETAFTSINRIRLKNKADNGDKRAAKTLALAETESSFAVTSRCFCSSSSRRFARVD